nr:glycosyltransferase family 2 protein [Exiguobacterium sp. s50]
MPAYNCEKYIQDAIDSVVKQSYQEWELLVLDDGSSDKTLEIVQKIEMTDRRIISLPNIKNLGVSATRNKGIEKASGEWIAFLDSDDMWEPSKLQKQIDLAIKNTGEFIFTGSSYINQEGTKLNGIFQVPDIVTYKSLLNQNVISCSSVMVKKRLFENVKMEKDDLHEDYAVWLKILNKNVAAYGINEPLLIYRLALNSKSGNKIKSIKMTYNVFRFIGLKPLESLYFTTKHLVGAVIKYKKILLK